jgi:hypothetical protein
MITNIAFAIESEEQLKAVEALYKAYGYKWFAQPRRVGESLRLSLDRNPTRNEIGQIGTLTGYETTYWKDKTVVLHSVNKPFKIAGHDTTLKKEGVQVGCTFVSWKEVEKINKERISKGF